MTHARAVSTNIGSVTAEDSQNNVGRRNSSYTASKDLRQAPRLRKAVHPFKMDA